MVERLDVEQFVHFNFYLLKRLLTIFPFFVAFAANAQRTLFGRNNNYVVPVVPVTLVPTGINPVTNGLILYLDATRTASYGGTGTTWNDISGQTPANTATLVGSPSFGSGNL